MQVITSRLSSIPHSKPWASPTPTGLLVWYTGQTRRDNLHIKMTLVRYRLYINLLLLLRFRYNFLAANPPATPPPTRASPKIIPPAIPPAAWAEIVNVSYYDFYVRSLTFKNNYETKGQYTPPTIPLWKDRDIGTLSCFCYGAAHAQR